MTRKECLDAAASCVLKDRQNQYGGPENNFERIAQMWNGYLGTTMIKPWDVAAMMSLLKMARARFNPKYADNWVDMAGYAACGIECATAQEEFDKALNKHQQEILDRMLNKAEGNHPEIPDSSTEASAEPEYEPHERVQVRYAPGHWCGAEYICRASRWGHVVFVPGEKEEQMFRNEDVRKWPRAEGCEELVQKDLADECEGCLYRLAADAPQTPKETCQRIVDSNPATYGQPRTPTGEELAEMAEEDAHV